MCTYCGCNVVIRKHEDKFGDEYLDHLFLEIDLVAKHIGKKMPVKQFHWGGGTPTFLNEGQIERLFHKVTEHFDVDPDGEIAIEIDPRTIDASKVKKLRALGFNRISMGVQDFDPKVQEAVNRRQSFEMVQEYTNLCRDLKFRSLNFDLIYGLPFQTQESFLKTVSKVIALKPDRIALYSFAYVPWLKKHQNKIEQDSLPSSDAKLDIFLSARSEFLANGYQSIAMDHFALESDDMAKAFNNGTLYRNFMGYTLKPADEYIGLGLTSISYLENTYIHNGKVLPEYYKLLGSGKLPVERGKILTEDDRIRQWTINHLICQFHIDKNVFKEQFQVGFNIVLNSLEAPLKQIAINAGKDDGSVIVDKVKNSKGFAGYDASKDEMVEDLVLAGIIDPVKVTRSGVQNATSAAGILLTTEVAIADDPEVEKSSGGGHPQMPMGGMGGMM